MKKLSMKMLIIGLLISIGLCFGFTLLISAQTENDPNDTPWDVNQDRIVNVLDLVIVGQNFGTSNAVADLNEDGTVNVLDLVLVAQHFGERTPELLIVRQLYWGDIGTRKIQRADADGSNIQTIVTGVFDGTDIEDIVTTGLSRPISIVIDLGPIN